MVHWWMQVVETGGAPGDAGLMVTWPLHVPLKSGYGTGAVELLQPAHVTQTKMLIDFQKRCAIPVTRFLSILVQCGGDVAVVAAILLQHTLRTDRSPYTMVMVRLAGNYQGWRLRTRARGSKRTVLPRGGPQTLR